MNAILSIGSHQLVVEARAIHLDMAKALQAQGLQFSVNTEIGSLSAGSAARAGTKDASMAENGYGIYEPHCGYPLVESSERRPEMLKRVESAIRVSRNGLLTLASRMITRWRLCSGRYFWPDRDRRPLLTKAL